MGQGLYVQITANVVMESVFDAIKNRRLPPGRRLFFTGFLPILNVSARIVDSRGKRSVTDHRTVAGTTALIRHV